MQKISILLVLKNNFNTLVFKEKYSERSEMVKCSVNYKNLNTKTQYSKKRFLTVGLYTILPY